jgi:soluble cytochrome b562
MPTQIGRLWTTVFFLALFTVQTCCGQEPSANKVDEESIWMKKKLEYSRHILEGLATADFDKIASNAQAMQSLNKIENFIRGRTPGYRHQLQIFQSATAEILKQAEQENVEGAALAFTQLTTSCVNCHKQLRIAKTAENNATPANKP